MSHKADLSWITDDLATGGDMSFDPAIAIDQALDIERQGVGYIIDMRQEANDHDMWGIEDFRKKIRYTWLPTDDRAGHTLPADLFDAAVQLDREARQDGEKVFVHCHMGINRGPSVAYALLLDRGYGITEAFDMIRSARYQAGIYYAKDALKAHHDRRLREGNLGFDRGAERIALNKHIKDTMSDEVWGGIQHIMRDNHKRDADTWNRVSRSISVDAD